MHVIEYDKFSNRIRYQLHDRVKEMTILIREGSYLNDLNKQGVQTRAITGKKDILSFLGNSFARSVKCTFFKNVM